MRLGEEGWGIIVASIFFGTDNDAFCRVLAVATGAVTTNGTDDDGLPLVLVTDIAIETNHAIFTRIIT